MSKTSLAVTLLVENLLLCAVLLAYPSMRKQEDRRTFGDTADCVTALWRATVVRPTAIKIDATIKNSQGHTQTVSATTQENTPEFEQMIASLERSADEVRRPIIGSHSDSDFRLVSCDITVQAYGGALSEWQYLHGALHCVSPIDPKGPIADIPISLDQEVFESAIIHLVTSK